MLRTLSVPYVIYWLLVKDFFHNVDVCNSSNSEPGHCLSMSDCNKFGTDMGSCDSAITDLVCCKLTFDYFNETYLLKQIFVRKSQTDTVQKMLLFSSGGSCNETYIHNDNKSMLLKQKERIFFNPEVHVSETPDRIIWPIWASYLRESRDLKKQSFGTHHLYVVELNKLVLGEQYNTPHPVSECLSESDEEENFYLFLNPEKRFPVRKFFSQRMQELNTMNLTVDASGFIDEIESEKRNRRSVYLGMEKSEALTCEKQQWEDVLNVEIQKDIGDIQSTFERSHNILKQMNKSEGDLKIYNETIQSVLNNVLKSNVVSKELTKDKDIKKEFAYDKVNENKITSNEPSFNAKFSDSSVNSKGMEEKVTVRYREIPAFVKIPIQGNLNKELHRHLESNVYAYMQTQESDTRYDSRKPVQIEASHSMRNLVSLKTTHDLRKLVQSHESHDMRKPVKFEATHDMRIAVQISVDHNMRKPVETGKGSDQREDKHDMRKPVTFDESHDLRWPVLETMNDLRNLYKESDAYENVNFESGDPQRAHGETGDDKNANVTMQNVFSNCKVDISLFSKKEFHKESPYEKIQKQKRLKDLWKGASRACGINSKSTTNRSISKIDEQWPWMVSLHENISGRYKHKCSASLLNNLWIITVAHCVDMKPKGNIVLVLGNQLPIDGKENFTERAIEEIVIHPKFKRGLFENDLALLRLKMPVTFQSAISPICLPWTFKELTHAIPIYLGWKQKDQRTFEDLKELSVPIMTNYECEILYSTGKYKEKIKDTFLCAGEDRRSCDIESGSSLIALDTEGRWSLIGLVSWGSMCTNPKIPAVYIRISSYTQWIKDVMDCYEILM